MYAQMAQNVSTLAKGSAGSKEVRIFILAQVISLTPLQKRCTQSLLQAQPVDERFGFPSALY